MSLVTIKGKTRTITIDSRALDRRYAVVIPPTRPAEAEMLFTYLSRAVDILGLDQTGDDHGSLGFEKIVRTMDDDLSTLKDKMEVFDGVLLDRGLTAEALDFGDNCLLSNAVVYGETSSYISFEPENVGKGRKERLVEDFVGAAVHNALVDLVGWNRKPWAAEPESWSTDETEPDYPSHGLCLKNILILGADDPIGRAAASELVWNYWDKGCRFTLVGDNCDDFNLLADKMDEFNCTSRHVTLLPFDEAEPIISAVDSADIIVSCVPNYQKLPLDHITDKHIVLDTQAGIESPLLKKARAVGARVEDGSRVKAYEAVEFFAEVLHLNIPKSVLAEFPDYPRVELA